jgi:ABC-2 type transport system permease protein
MFNQIKLVAGQVYRTKIKTPSFWLTVLAPLLVPVFSLVIGYVIAKTTDDTVARLAVVDNTALVQTLKTNKVLDAKISEAADIETAKQKVLDNKIDGYLVKSDGKYTLVTSTEGTKKFMEETVKSVLSQIDLADKATQLNLSATELLSLQTPADLTMKTLSDKGETSGGSAKNAANAMISSGVTILIVILLMVYASMLAQEIANEKSNRIMETLLAATSAKVQYFGKIIGVSLLVLTHLLFYVLLAVVANFALKGNEMVKGIKELLSGVDAHFLIFAVLMLLVGLLSYLFLTAIIASLVNDQGQVQQAVAPISYLAMTGYVAGLVGAATPNNIVIKVLDFIPFVSPSLVTSRLASEQTTLTNAYIALAVQFVVLILLAKFGEKIYAKNVLSYSDEKIFKQFIHNLKK